MYIYEAESGGLLGRYLKLLSRAASSSGECRLSIVTSGLGASKCFTHCGIRVGLESVVALTRGFFRMRPHPLMRADSRCMTCF